MKLRILWVVLLGGMLAPLLRPPRQEGCGTLDMACAAETGFHLGLYAVAAVIWWFTQGLLAFSRFLETARDWLLYEVIGNAFGVFLHVIYPWILISAALAVLFFMMAQALIALTRRSWVELRSAVWNALLTAAILTAGAKSIVLAEQFRLMGSHAAFHMGMGSVQRAGSVDFLVQSSNPEDAVATPVTIYGATSPTCDRMPLQRMMRDATGMKVPAPDQMYLNDYTAIFLFAAAPDIHCPPAAMSLPLVFEKGYANPDEGSFPGYFPHYGAQFAVLPEAERIRFIVRGAIGDVRMLIGFVLALGANLEQILHLVFLVAIASGFFGFTSARMIAYFAPLEHLARMQWEALVKVYVSSFMAWLWIGIALGITHRVAMDGNAQLTALAALFTLGVILWRMWVARGPLLASFNAASAMASHSPRAFLNAGTGMYRAARGLATDGALVGIAIATGGGSPIIGAALRKLGHSAGHSTLGKSAGRHLGGHAAGRLGGVFERIEDNRAERREADEQFWWQTRQYAGAGTPAADARAQERIAELRESRIERQRRRADTLLTQAHRRRNWSGVDQALRQRPAPPRPRKKP